MGKSRRRYCGYAFNDIYKISGRVYRKAVCITLVINGEWQTELFSITRQNGIARENRVEKLISWLTKLTSDANKTGRMG